MKKTSIYWFVGLTVLALAYCIFMQVPVFESSILVTGVLCVALIAIGKKEGYIFGLYNWISYAWVAYENGLFGEVLLNLIFYVPTGILGYFMWQKHQQDESVIMRRLSSNDFLKIFGGVVIFILILGFALSQFEKQNNPFIDATTNAVGICATLLMMYRYAEQWVFYILLNSITITLWVLQYLNQSEEADAMVFMWMLFLVNSIYGYFIWMKKSKAKTPNYA